MDKDIEIKVPDIGDFKEIEVIDVLVKKGDKVEVENPLISLESEKATLDIPSTAAGTVKELKVKNGDRVSEGDLILILESTGEGKTDEQAPSPAEATKTPEPAGKPAPATGEKKVEKAPAKKTAPSASLEKEMNIEVPDIGDFKEVEVIDILVNAGDEVEKETPLISLESEKATIDIPSPEAGTIKKILVKNGDKVSKGSPIALIAARQAGETPAEPAKQEEKPALDKARPDQAEDRKPEPAGPDTPPAVAASASGPVHASPSVRMFAREIGVDLARVKGSGRKGRILREDVTAYTKTALSGQAGAGDRGLASLFEIPAVDFSKFGETEKIALSKINRLTSENLHRSWVNIPHVTQFDEADITELEEYRVSKTPEAEKHGTKLTLLSFLIKAVVSMLKKYPRFNASLSPGGEELILKKYYNVGFAVNTSQGLMVPVIKDADKKGIYEIAKELVSLAQKARDKKLPPADMQGACFTISSLGHISGTGFTPIINPPEVAILGVSRSSTRPVYVDGKFEPRLILPFSLSYDHRVIDGVAGAEFTRELGEVLSDIRELIL